MGKVARAMAWGKGQVGLARRGGGLPDWRDWADALACHSRGRRQDMADHAPLLQKIQERIAEKDQVISEQLDQISELEDKISSLDKEVTELRKVKQEYDDLRKQLDEML
jgi:uncharacterized protein (DUF3084 family)